MSSASAYNKFTELMVRDVLDKLQGKHASFERIITREKPSRSIFVGSLGDLEEEEITNYNKIRLKNNSLSVKFLLEDYKENITVIPTLSVYYRVYPTYEEQLNFVNNMKFEKKADVPLAKIWVRKIISFDPADFHEKTEHYLNFSEIIGSITNSKDFYHSGNLIPYKSLKNESDYKNTLKSLKNKQMIKLDWKCKIYMDLERFEQNNKNLNLIELSMVNETVPNFKYETFFFDCSLEILLNNNIIVPFEYDYKYEDIPKSYSSYLRCINCHANFNFNQNKIMTESYARFKQPKISPKTSAGDLSLTFNNLSKEKCLNDLNKLYSLMEEHYSNCSKSANTDLEYFDSLKNFEKMKKRFLDGISLLKDNKKAFKAFKLTNEAFFYNSKYYNSWRLFQIVFFVSMVPEIVNKVKGRDYCELLHVMTGGGKSEAYFALVIFSAFFDRISGKKFGVTALTKFPLRMLSIQQLQRIANLFIWAEKLRSDEKLGGEPFSIAYFVGESDDFPRSNRKLIDEINRNKDKESELKGRIIDKCPLCKGKVLLSVEESKKIVLHKCDKCGKSFRLLICDDEIYRTLPTFIVCTVDKLAGVALNRRFKNLFGGKLDKCPNGHGFIPRNDQCDFNVNPKEKCGEKGSPLELDFDTGPSLIIQDEMHLVKEGFGTIDSHFESLFEAMHYEFSGFKFKNIAMTATVTGARNQIEHLYQKRTRIFPPRLKDENGNDFFYEYSADDIQRQIIGLKPNFRDINTSVLFNIRYISEFIKMVEQDLPKFASKHNIEAEKLSAVVKNYKNILTYHIKKSDVHLITSYMDDFVNSKSSVYHVDSITLTGDNNLEYIKDVIKKVNVFTDMHNKKERLLAVSATSIVSHGVDIDKWNLMLFEGMPRSVSEYIQSLSRVGRKFPGLVFLWFFPNRTRDMSYYQNFNEFHDILEHKVEHVPLSRWAKLGFKQTFTSIFNAAILNYLSNVLERPVYSLAQIVEVISEKENYELLINFLNKVYTSDFDLIEHNHLIPAIKAETEARVNYLKEYNGNEIYFFPNALKNSDKKYYKTQYGMRGIQDEIILSPDYNDLGFISRRRN
ncbi:MAG: DEAD/DEAH box helicase family protein [Methanomicrobiales archaeon]